MMRDVQHDQTRHLPVPGYDDTTLVERLGLIAQGGRYVQRPDLKPGERIDVVEGRIVYSARWL
jgi:hypothetical protein